MVDLVQIEKFEPKIHFYDEDNIFFPPRIILLASSGSGKSWLLRSLLYETHQSLYNCLLFSETENPSKRFFTKHIPYKSLYNKYKEKKFEKLTEN